MFATVYFQGCLSELPRRRASLEDIKHRADSLPVERRQLLEPKFITVVSRFDQVGAKCLNSNESLC